MEVRVPGRDLSGWLSGACRVLFEGELVVPRLEVDLAESLAAVLSHPN
jgi:hypothetical protein